MILTSPDFGQGETIPAEYTCDGEDRSPSFAWSGMPEDAKTLLFVCDDPDAPGGVFHHWAAYNIPPTWTGLKAGYGAETLEEDFLQAINDFGRPGYAGPCPPKADKPHGYHFRLSALSTTIVSAAPSANCVEIITLARPHVMDFVELVGFYGR
ncbi:MAG: YbhB/YbcL family Raf kinase inhibitor-like protein [Alphaproteobacteria bacterium]